MKRGEESPRENGNRWSRHGFILAPSLSFIDSFIHTLTDEGGEKYVMRVSASVFFTCKWNLSPRQSLHNNLPSSSTLPTHVVRSTGSSDAADVGGCPVKEEDAGGRCPPSTIPSTAVPPFTLRRLVRES